LLKLGTLLDSVNAPLAGSLSFPVLPRTEK
jgi:hypothetical protein